MYDTCSAEKNTLSMKPIDDFTWIHKRWLVIKNGDGYLLWHSSDPPGTKERGIAPTLNVPRYLIDQFHLFLKKDKT